MSDTSDLSRSAKEHVKDLGAQAKAAATQEAAARVDSVKHGAADRVQAAANAADAAAHEMDPSSPQAQAVQQVADRIEGVAAHLRGADMQQLAGQAKDIARRHPLLFIGGAALAGFAAARFLKATDPHGSAARAHTDPWASEGGWSDD